MPQPQPMPCFSAGYSVHLDPSLQHPDQLPTATGRPPAATSNYSPSAPRAAETEQDVAAVLAEIAAPEEGLTPAAGAVPDLHVGDVGRAPTRSRPR